MNTVPERRKLPIGIQDFEKLRSEHFLYVDKTGLVYKLVHLEVPYFLSRPRRFGKSLLLSTLRAYWEGKRELFAGLEIERLESGNPEAWKPHPVFYFDFNKKNFQRTTALEEVLDDHLREWEAVYGDEFKDAPLEERFQHLLVKAHEQTRLRCVVLVDEYDKPLLETITNDELEEHNKAVFKGFFSTLKSYDRHLKFVFLTGVTKFSKVSIFSDLNHLNDISMSEDYAGICGITQAELEQTFGTEIDALAAGNRLTREECLAQLKQMYDGYHFSEAGAGVYNPFSLINALNERKFRSYWFATGTPTFLIKKLEQTGYDAKKLTSDDLYEDEDELRDYRADNPDPVPLFYQSGYLTIKAFDEGLRSYQLGYPNDEVKYAFIKSLAPMFLHDEESGSPLDIREFVIDLRRARLDELRDRLTALFARLPYSADDKPMERDFQNVVYIVFMLLGQFVRTELHSAKGRADCVVETADYVYIFEFKRDGSTQDALAQIKEKGYEKPYAADSRTLYKIGANFDSKTRDLDGWQVEERTAQ